MSKTIAFFCGASSNVDESYKDCARRSGTLAGVQGWHVVYGGGHVGLMGILADAALAGGSRVTGVIPKFLQDREVAHEGLSALFVTQTMQERQLKMFNLSDAFVILPGGLGTMAEFFEVLTWKQIGLHQKPIVLLNHSGYWDHILKWIEYAGAQNFMHSISGPIFSIIDNPDDLVSIFSA